MTHPTIGGLYLGKAGVGSLLSPTPYTCPAGVNIRDAVQLTAADAVDVADANVAADRPSIGLVFAKPTATSCIVIYGGEIGGFVGLTVDATYYLDDAVPGNIITPEPVGSGSIIQAIGYARSTTVLVVTVDRFFTLIP